jgi:hypothetical protein
MANFYFQIDKTDEISLEKTKMIFNSKCRENLKIDDKDGDYIGFTITFENELEKQNFLEELKKNGLGFSLE